MLLFPFDLTRWPEVPAGLRQGSFVALVVCGNTTGPSLGHQFPFEQGSLCLGVAFSLGHFSSIHFIPWGLMSTAKASVDYYCLPLPYNRCTWLPGSEECEGLALCIQH